MDQAPGGALILRTKAGISFMVPRSGRVTLLDNADGHFLRADRLWAGEAPAGTGRFSQAEPRPDGLILIVGSEPVPRAAPLLSYIGWYGYRIRHALSPAADLATWRMMDLLFNRPERGQDEKPPTHSWWAFDPGRGTLDRLPPPRNFPPLPVGPTALAPEFLVMPDGNLASTSPISLKARRPGLLVRLLSPIRLLPARPWGRRKGGTR